MKTVYFSEDDMCTTQMLQLARVQSWFLLNGWQVIQDEAKADLALCLTCNGWSLLERRSFERIEKMKKTTKDDALVVFGCINDAHPKQVAKVHQGKTVSNKLIDEQIDALIPDAKIKFADVPHSSTFRTKADYRVWDPKKHFVNVANGCTFNCSFCTHKPGLGKRRSRTKQDIVQQVEKLVAQGVETIVLTGMETGYYGLEHGTSFPDMLKDVLAVDDSFDVHIAQFNPSGIHKFYDEMLPLVQSKRIADFQLPIQTTSSRLLQMMKRPNHYQEVDQFMVEMRRFNNRAITRTDLIIGWPTETMDELNHSLEFAVKHFDEIAAYVIELSPDLPAWKYKPDAFDQEELNRRLAYAKAFIESHGRMAHCGQQDDPTMASVEERRKKMREERRII